MGRKMVARLMQEFHLSRLLPSLCEDKLLDQDDFTTGIAILFGTRPANPPGMRIATFGRGNDF